MTIAELGRAVAVCIVGSTSPLNRCCLKPILLLYRCHQSVALHMGCGMQPMAPAHGYTIIIRVIDVTSLN
jgi:hypothetical protein